MNIPTAEETLAAERFHAYKRGWRDGAMSKAAYEGYLGHTRKEIVKEYKLGYEDGNASRSRIMSEAMLRIGYSPNILRASEDKNEDGN